jgi:hypothetical protein
VIPLRHYSQPGEIEDDHARTGEFEEKWGIQNEKQRAATKSRTNHRRQNARSTVNRTANRAISGQGRSIRASAAGRHENRNRK